MKYIVTDIKYDTDGQDIDLPKELIIDIPENGVHPEEIDQYLSDAISDNTGFCHFGFSAVQMPLFQFMDGMIFGHEQMQARDRDHLAQLCGVIKPIFEEGENGEFQIYEKTRFTGSKNFVITAKKVEKK